MLPAWSNSNHSKISPKKLLASTHTASKVLKQNKGQVGHFVAGYLWISHIKQPSPIRILLTSRACPRFFAFVVCLWHPIGLPIPAIVAMESGRLVEWAKLEVVYLAKCNHFHLDRFFSLGMIKNSSASLVCRCVSSTTWKDWKGKGGQVYLYIYIHQSIYIFIYIYTL